MCAVGIVPADKAFEAENCGAHSALLALAACSVIFCFKAATQIRWGSCVLCLEHLAPGSRGLQE